MTFKAAFFCSAALHAFFMSARPPQGVTPPRAVLQTLEVTYQPAAPKRVAAPAPTPAAAVPKRAAPPSSAAAAPELKHVPVRPEPAKPAPKRAAPVPPSAAAAKIPPGSATHLPEWEFAQVQHKEQVRWHLKAHLNYPAVLLEGTVRLRMLLSPDGRMEKVQVLAASDPRLNDQALSDSRRAQPYPRFPAALRRRQAAYEFLIRYEPNDR